MAGASGRPRWVRRSLAPLAIAVTVLVVDQVSKLLIRDWLPGRPGDPVVGLPGDWIGLQYVENRGAAFGVLAGAGGLLTGVALVVVAAAVIVYARIPAPSRWLTLGLGLLASGAIGNALDRLLLGYVVDFIAVGPWPRFNVADSAITVGVLLLAWRLSGDEYATGSRTSADRAASGTGERPADDHPTTARTNGK